MRLAETAETGEDRRALPSRAGFRCPRKDPMRRTEVTIEEHHSGNVTERVASLDEIRAGEGFMCVFTAHPVSLSPLHKWPVWERAENGLFRNRKSGEVDSYVSSTYDFFRVKE